MHYTSLTEFIAQNHATLSKGPIAIIIVEDDVEVASTLEHHLKLGFKQVLVFLPQEVSIEAELASKVHVIPFRNRSKTHAIDIVNRLIPSALGSWIYYGYNAEYLFFPFCETRTIGEMLTFHTEERRDAMLTYVIDIYAQNLNDHPDAVSRDTAMLDETGYYALARPDPKNHNHPKERQLDFYGGLRWRFEEHIPNAQRKLDRISLFRAAPGLELKPNHTFNIEEYNTYACPWHNNLTAAVMSFRTAKALKLNPGSSFDIKSFEWTRSVKFNWHSMQLMELGLMEPGQWF
ncbi:MAG: glycosyltransferase family 2 protein [Halocynthiibacter sp.]